MPSAGGRPRGGVPAEPHHGGNRLNGPIGYATRLIPGHGAGLKAAMRSGFGTALSVGAVGQVVPDDRSRIDLDPARTDATGLPLPRLSSVLTAASLARLRAMRDAARAVLASAGPGWSKKPASRCLFGHPCLRYCPDGHRPCGLGNSPTGRTHDHPNLWIADASVFSRTGFGESPSLTIMALALRTAIAATA